MEDYSYSSNTIPLKNASVLFASAHGSSQNTLFNNIRSIVKSFIDKDGPDILPDILDIDDEGQPFIIFDAEYLDYLSDKEYYAYINEQKPKLKNKASPMVERAMKDIKNFIYTNVLYSPMARTNSLAFANKDIIDSYLKYGLSQYGSLKINDITSSNLKTKFKNVRKYNNIINSNEKYLIQHDKLIDYFQWKYNIPKMYNIIKLDENNEHLLLKPAKPDAMFLKNKVDKTHVVNASWLIRENNKALLQIPLLKNNHPDDKFMIWVKDQLGIIPKLSKHQYDGDRTKTINSVDTLKKYYGDVTDTVKVLRSKLYTYVMNTNNYVEERIIEYHNWKQGHYMYDGILNEKTPDQSYHFVPKIDAQDEKKHLGLHRLLYLKDGKKHLNYATKSRPKHLNQLYCSLPKSNKQSLIQPVVRKPVSYDDTISYIKKTIYYKICKNMNEKLSVPLSWIILHAWADNMDHLTIFAVACRKYNPNDVDITDDPLRRKTSVRESRKVNNIRSIRQSLKHNMGDKLKFNKHSKRKKTNKIVYPSKSKTPIKTKLSESKIKTCPPGSSINPKTGRCRKDCLPNKTRNNKGNCVENKKLLTKKCTTGKELNPDTNRCRNKCENTKIRNEKGNCVVNKH
jgi:hypothetical protein